MIALGAYQLETLIGRGGASEVWRGQHCDAELPVAVKIAHNPLSDDQQDLFFEEAIRMTRLQHPGIIQIYDYGQIPEQTAKESLGLLQEGRPYLVLELAAAGLFHYTGELPWSLLFRIQLTLLEALAYIHARGVLHCDIKPSNLLIAKDLRRIQLSDFGIACQFDELSKRYRRRSLLGTPSYMAPEQFNRSWRDYGPWTDLYAFGCTAMELVTGAPPFGHKQSLETIKQAHLFDTIPPLAADVDVPAGYSHWLSRLLAKDPIDRFQCAADAAWALEHLHRSKESEGEGDPASKVQEAPFSSLLGEPDVGKEAFAFLPTLIETKMIHTFSTTSIPATEEPLGSVSTGDRELPVRVGPPPTEPELPTMEWVQSPYPSGPPPFPRRWPGQCQRPPHRLIGHRLQPHRLPPSEVREREQTLLWEALGRVCSSGQPGALLLEGPSGAGKTHLAQWLVQCARQSGVATCLPTLHQQTPSSRHGLLGMLKQYLRCYGLEGQALFYQISARMSVSEPCPAPDTQQTRAMRTVPWDLLAGWIEQPTPEPPDVFLQFLAHLCEQRPVLFWLDDAQWDPALLRWCYEWLSEPALKLPVFVLATLRTPLQHAPAEPWLAQLRQLDLCESLCLPPSLRAPDTQEERKGPQC